MKKAFSLLLILCMVLSLLTVCAGSVYADGTDYTVTFTTPDGITPPAAMTINSLEGAELPTADAPAAYTFLGWVTEDYDNVTEQPSQILSGLYLPTADITLQALDVYNDYGENPPTLTLMTVNDTLSEGDKIVITAAGTEFGLYRQSHSWNHVKNFTFTNNAAVILSDPKMYFPVTQADIGWYLGDNDNGWLYTPANTTNLSIKADNSNFMASFALTTYEDHLVLMDTIDYNPSVFYLSCRTNISGTNQNQWAMVNADSISGVVTLDIYKLTEGGTPVATYTTIVILPHEHDPGAPVVENEVPASCTAAGGYDTVVYCTVCGQELSRESTVLPALGHDYVATVTPPTETQQGYTTHVCSRCGDTYVDSYVPALGSDFTVHFSVPAGVTKPADMVSNTNTGITLPTADAPEGYTFLGWVTEDYDNVETRPAEILTGNYIAPQEITLKALYTYVEGNSGSETVYELVSTAPSDLAGDYVITFGTSETSNEQGFFLMKGVEAATSNYGIESPANRVAYADTGATLEGTTLKNVADDYIFNVAFLGTYYTIRSKTTGIYLGMNSSSYFSGYGTYNSTYCRWTIPAVAENFCSAKNARSGATYPYISFGYESNQYSEPYFWAGSSSSIGSTGLALSVRWWKATEIEAGTSYYTTIIGEEHVHTPAAPVIENEVPATCTTAGSYDSVVYCSECGEEISRETVTVPALGHTAGTAVKENEVAATCTAAGSYDMVVYCTVCGAELSRETTTVPALGHNWSAWTSNNDGTHSRTCSVCSETETHDCEFGDDDVCDVCGYERSTEMDLFIGMTLSLEGATSVNYLVPKAALDAYGLDSFKMVVVHTDYDRDTGVYSEETRELAAEAELYVAGGANYYKFVYAEIPAMKLNDVMIAHVEGEKDGVTFTSAVLERNPIQYCYNATNNAAAGENLQKTCANMILYAAAAQTLFNYNTANLATAAWTQTQEALCERDVPAWENIDSREPLESGKLVNIIGTTLDVNSRVDMRYVMSFEDGVDYTTLTMYCTYTTYQDDTVTVEIPGTTWTDYQGYKAATMDVLNAAEMRSLISAVVKDANGNVVSETYHTNVQSYGCKIYNNASAPQNLKDLMVAMVNYGDAAEVLLKNK